MPHDQVPSRAALLRDCLEAGGIVVVWCGVGASRGRAAQEARREGVRLLAQLGTTNLHISRSACHGLAVVALSQQQEVGVDVEAVQAIAAAESSAWLHPRELSGPRSGLQTHGVAVWVRKEAVLKVLGVGLAVQPCGFETGGESLDWQGVQVGKYGLAQVRSLNAPSPGIHAALAVRLAARPTVFTYATVP